MPRRHPNHRLVKIHRNYTVDEVAKLLGVHRNTVREWLKGGLPTCDDRRPTLILGPALVTFLRDRRARNKRPCQPGQLYCVRCRAAQNAAGGFADYQPINATLGNLVAICPSCDGVMNRRVNPAKLERIRGNLEVRLPMPQSQLNETKNPSVNCDFKGRGVSCHDAQSE